ncbi:MAG: PEP-CTERM sorting domain-containing protein [Elainellaceae cyanobacterium]
MLVSNKFSLVNWSQAISKVLLGAVGLVVVSSSLGVAEAQARDINYQIDGTFGELADFSDDVPNEFFDSLEGGSFQATIGYSSDTPDQEFIFTFEPLDFVGFYPLDSFHIELFSADGSTVLTDSLEEGNYFLGPLGIVVREGAFNFWELYLESSPFPEGMFVAFEYSGDANVAPTELPGDFIDGNIDEIGYFLPITDATVSDAPVSKSNDRVEDVPEPMSVIGLVVGTAGAGLLLKRRQSEHA